MCVSSSTNSTLCTPNKLRLQGRNGRCFTLDQYIIARLNKTSIWQRYGIKYTSFEAIILSCQLHSIFR